MPDDAPAAPRANGILTWIRSNTGVLILAGVLVAWFQYHSANTARQIELLAEQIGARMESLEDNQKLVAEQLGARMTSLEQNQKLIAEQLGARMTSLERDVRELRAALGDVLERLSRIEGRLSLPVREAPPDPERPPSSED